MSSADARVGRPLTPMSYAGVARRDDAPGRGGRGGAAPVVVAPRPVVVPVPVRRCVQAVDAYGRIITRC